MRPQSVTLSAAGFSSWLNIDRMPVGHFGVALGVQLSDGATLTYSVQHTMDQLYTPTKEWSAARTTTTGTISLTDHGLVAGDWVEMDAAAPFNQAYEVASVTDANTFVITVADAGATAVPRGWSNLWKARVKNTSGLTGLTADADGNYNFPPTACRLKITAWTDGKATLNVIQAG